MKNIFSILLAILILPIGINGQALSEINGLAYDKDGELANGRYVCYYENGNIKKEYNYYYGIRQGEFKVYYESGELKESGFYSENVKDGIWIHLNECGDKIGEARYENDHKAGNGRFGMKEVFFAQSCSLMVETKLEYGSNMILKEHCLWLSLISPVLK